ncbi:two-component sensor histidine kinase [Zhengella mangrovi]|uniref:histidine kinase n=1 Tax=Zhengella mangrovi TaxID=1982044 RepID=A0A2G1QHE2_9HYPH|nr:HAMP domain-containing sensor histidine kinase [Zhengella mangrovi]PHP64936.1 two-component sensor histidine kinase [Zhengella mangrovi]
MSVAFSDIADKNVLDKRKAHRNSEVARAVRSTREKLATRPGNVNFDRALLKMHANSVLASSFSFPILIGIVTVAGLALNIGLQMVIWGLMAILLYGGVILTARKVRATPEDRIDVPVVTRRFLFAHAIAGLGWAGFVFLPCETCGPDQAAIMRAVLLLLAIAATAVIAWALNGALIASFAAPVALNAYMSILDFDPVRMSMGVMLIAALPFFAYISRHLHRTAVMTLSFRSENDALIAELETANAISDEARRRAEEANLAKSRFLASMSHELRTPLNAILGFSEVMAGEMLGPLRNETYKEYARDIHGSGKHLLDLINEILDLSRIEAGRYQINEEPVALVEILDDCVHMLDMKIRAKDIRIAKQYHSGLPFVMADERSVRQVALNLLSNAVKFTPQAGEIVIRAGWTRSGGQYMAIIDNGPGIPEEEIPVVLSAFGQGSIAIKSAEQGTGLGLPIVQAIMQMHGGRFDLKSKLRVGTEVIATFPAKRVQPEMNQDRESA